MSHGQNVTVDVRLGQNVTVAVVNLNNNVLAAEHGLMETDCGGGGGEEHMSYLVFKNCC